MELNLPTSSPRILCCLAVCLFCTPSLTLAKIAHLERKMPVEYGGNDGLDACSTVGHVGSLSSGPDGFLAVKDSPDLKAKRTDKLYNNQQVWICSASKDDRWLGIVYTKDSKKDCGTTVDVKRRMPYNGPCNLGWVDKKWIVLDAG